MRLATVAALAAVAVFSVVGLKASASDPLSGRISITGVIKEHHPADTLAFPSRESWYYSLASPRRPGAPFGYGILACALVSTATSVRQCAGTFSLPRGKLIVAGSFLYPSLFVLAVTGGTNLYVSVGGTFTARHVPNTSTYRFQFDLR